MMKYILTANIGPEAALQPFLQLLPANIVPLTVPSRDLSIAQARSCFDVQPELNGFLLTVGFNPVAGADWRTEAILPLRTAFGLLTGAASRLRGSDEASRIIVIIPAPALAPFDGPCASNVLLRSILGLTEALRAELGSTSVKVSILFYSIATLDPANLLNRFECCLNSGQMYSLPADLDEEAIHEYFDPILQALERTSEGPPLPDIGPMATVYDLSACGIISRT